MTAMRLVIEVYGGTVQNLYVTGLDNSLKLEALTVNWDGFDPGQAPDADAGEHAELAASNAISRPRLKPWHSLSAAGIQELLERSGLAEYGAALERAAPAGERSVTGPDPSAARGARCIGLTANE